VPHCRLSYGLGNLEDLVYLFVFFFKAKNSQIS